MTSTINNVPLNELNACLSCCYTKTSECQLFAFNKNKEVFTKANVIKLHEAKQFTHEVPIYFGWKKGAFALRYNLHDGAMQLFKFNADLTGIEPLQSLHEKDCANFNHIAPLFFHGDAAKPGLFGYNEKSGDAFMLLLEQVDQSHIKIAKKVHLKLDANMSLVMPLWHPAGVSGLVAYCSQSGKVKSFLLNDNLQLQLVKESEIPKGFTAMQPLLPEFAASLPNMQMNKLPIVFYNKVSGESLFYGISKDFAHCEQIHKHTGMIGFDKNISFVANSKPHMLCLKLNDGLCNISVIDWEADKIKDIKEVSRTTIDPNPDVILRAYHTFDSAAPQQ